MDVEKLITAGGPLGVLAVVVWIFVKAWKDNSAEHRVWMTQTLQSNQTWTERMHAEHLYAREETRKCLDKNTSSMESNTLAVQKLADNVVGLTKKHGNHHET